MMPTLYGSIFLFSLVYLYVALIGCFYIAFQVVWINSSKLTVYNCCSIVLYILISNIYFYMIVYSLIMPLYYKYESF
jgi:hypothetical protein